MNRRVEFSLNMDNPSEAALYDALSDLLRHRRAGEVIRHALSAYLFGGTDLIPQRLAKVARPAPPTSAPPANSVPTDEQNTRRIVSQSAEMFGF